MGWPEALVIIVGLVCLTVMIVTPVQYPPGWSERKKRDDEK